MKKLALLLLCVPAMVLAVPADLGIDVQIPTTRQDGSNLDISEIQELVFYDGCGSTALEIGRVPPNGTVNLSVDWGDNSAHDLCFDTVDTFGQVGTRSAIYSFIFDSVAPPNAGAIQNVVVSCSGQVCRIVVL